MENALWDLTGFEVKFEVLKNQVKVHYDENKQDIQIAAIPFLEYTRAFTKNLKKIQLFLDTVDYSGNILLYNSTC